MQWSRLKNSVRTLWRPYLKNSILEKVNWLYNIGYENSLCVTHVIISSARKDLLVAASTSHNIVSLIETISGMVEAQRATKTHTSKGGFADFSGITE